MHYDLVDVKEKEQAAGWIKSDNKVYLCDLITSNFIVGGEYQYVSVNTRKEEKEDLYSLPSKKTSYINNLPCYEESFDHQIQTTLPVPLAEICTYVEGCHSENKSAFHSQFEVIVHNYILRRTLSTIIMYCSRTCVMEM